MITSTSDGSSPNYEIHSSPHESDERYQKLLDLLPDGVVVHADGVILLVNQATLRMMHAASASELIGKPLLDFLHPDCRANAIERQIRTLETNETAPPNEEIILRCDGTEFYADVSGSVVPYAGKKALQIVVRDISDRKVAYEKMRISEESFREMFENNSIAMSVIDRESYQLLEVNAAFLELYGYTRQEVLSGMNARDLRPAEDIPDFIRYMEQSRSTEAQFLKGGTWRHIKKNGELIDVQITWSDIVFNNRTARHVLINDITDYKKSKAALLEVNERFELVARATNDVIWDVDLSTDIIWWNDNFYTKFGYAKEATGMNSTSWSNNIHPLDKADVVAGIQQCIESRKPFWSAEYRFLTADKQTVSVLDRGYILYDEQGKASRIVGAMLDITERKKYQEELRLSQSRLSTIFETAMDAIITVDAQFRIILFNTAAERMFLCEAREVLGTPIDRFIPEGFRSQHQQQMLEFGATGEHAMAMGRQHDVYAMRANGGLFPVEASISHMYSDSGKLYNVILRDITDKKIADDRLRNSEEKFRSVVQNISDIITIIDANGVILYESPSIKNILGYEQDEILGRSVFEFIHPDDIERVTQAMQEAFTVAGRSKRIEYRFLAKDGSYIILESSGVNQFDNPAIGGLVVTSRDMTERKNAEDALRQSEEKFRAIMENSNVGFTLYDDNTSVIYMSPTNQHIFGYSMADLRAMHPYDLLHPDDRELTKVRLQLLLSGQEVAPVEFRWLMKDGKWKWIESNAFNYLENKSIRAILVTYQDVNQRHESDMQIRNQAALLDIVPDAIIMQELDGRILSWNKGAERIYGWTAQEAIGKQVCTILCGGNTGERTEPLDYLLTHGKWAGDLNLRTKAGASILVQSRWELVSNSGNQYTILMIDTDVTEKRTLEKQLYRAQRLESIGTLASGIAHDLNNILTPVVLGMELVKIRSNDEAVGKRVDSLIANVQRGSGLIRQVLTFARGAEEKYEAINVKYSINEVVKLARETFPREIQVMINLPTEDLIVKGNATQLHQVLLNLCINARDAMADHGGELRVEAAYCQPGDSIIKRFIDMKPGKYVAITVRDTGMGMSAEVQEKIFEPFFTTKEVGKGTGIGLTTVFSIVRSHGGFIDFVSEENVGTTFMMYLPAEEAGNESQVQFPIAKQAHTAERKTRVLFVDDEELLRLTAEDVLREHGYQVVTAIDGENAVQLYSQYKHDISIVITDIMMPNMNGMELIKVLCSMNPDIRIIATGGLMYGDAGMRIKELGAIDVLMKPYSALQLVECIEKVLARA
jgi:PAS domain S-box-containing protein